MLVLRRFNQKTEINGALKGNTQNILFRLMRMFQETRQYQLVDTG